MHDWRNFNNVSFESIMVILYDKGMTTVIHPGTWSQHPFVSGFCFFLGRTVYAMYAERSNQEPRSGFSFRQEKGVEIFLCFFFLCVYFIIDNNSVYIWRTYPSIKMLNQSACIIITPALAPAT